MILSLHPQIGGDVIAPVTLDLAPTASVRDQMLTHIARLGDVSRFDTFALPGHAGAALTAVAALEMITGLPVIIVNVDGDDSDPASPDLTLDLNMWRNREARAFRGELPTRGELPMRGRVDLDADTVIVFDGSGRGLTETQRCDLADHHDVPTSRLLVVDVSMGHVDLADITAGVIDRIVGSGLSFAQLTSHRLVFVPPGHAGVAVVLATAIYGLAESWPGVVRLGRDDAGTWRAGEVIDLWWVRQWGARHRAGGDPLILPPELARRVLALAETHDPELCAELRRLHGDLSELAGKNERWKP